jgi:hypothetical protein
VEGAAIMVSLPAREGRKIPVNKKLPDRRLELESVLRGILFVFICVFTLPVIVAFFVLTAALLNLGQGTSTYMTFPDNYWKSLLRLLFG